MWRLPTGLLPANRGLRTPGKTSARGSGSISRRHMACPSAPRTRRRLGGKRTARTWLTTGLPLWRGRSTRWHVPHLVLQILQSRPHKAPFAACGSRRWLVAPRAAPRALLAGDTLATHKRLRLRVPQLLDLAEDELAPRSFKLQFLSDGQAAIRRLRRQAVPLGQNLVDRRLAGHLGFRGRDGPDQFLRLRHQFIT